MADEPLTVRAINWRQTFPFINLFRAFRVAVHPSKLVLALAALILLFIGGHVLDLLWPMQYRAVTDEPALFEQFNNTARPGDKFPEKRQRVRDLVEKDYKNQLLKFHVETDDKTAALAAHDAGDLAVLKNKILGERDQKIKDDLKVSDAARHKAFVRDQFNEASAEYASAQRIRNLGLSDVYFDYESAQVSNVVRGVQEWNWFGEEYPTAVINPLGVTAPTGPNATAAPGVLQSVGRFFTVGPIWLLTQHPLYFILFGSYCLMVWSIFGGAICRIAAVHVARDEKLSIRSALMFSGGKFLSFLFAPIIPLMIVIVVGLLVTVCSAVAGIPWIGPIVVGLVFILALAAGFLMSLVLLGLVGGFNLMYPTVAVEGSDSFDAISRSFSYLYARPWRLGFYTIVSIIYGAVSYLFVRFFIYVMLVLTHKFAGFAIFSSTDGAVPLWGTLWPSPLTASRLTYSIDPMAMTLSQYIGARLIWFWVHLIIAMLGAFAVCFYFSSNTIIYYLMRHEVDATDLDDVYLEQTDDEFADPIAPDAAPVSPSISAPTADPLAGPPT